MKPLADFILIREHTIKEMKTHGGIIIPDRADARKQLGIGEVIRVGPGLVMANGTKNDIDVKIGDKVFYYKQHAVPILVHQEEMVILMERNIIGILEPEDFPDETKPSTAA